MTDLSDELIRLAGTIPEELAGRRLDQALAAMYRDYSRSRITDWIRRGEVRINQQPARPRDKVRGGERVDILARLEADASLMPEAIPLSLIHEDEHILVINKPPGLVVHPGAGNARHTLLNALLNHDPGLARLPRAGIVQRLDKDTSGLMVVARTPTAHTHLVEALQTRRVKREYRAIVTGVLIAGGTVDVPIGRHPRQRTRMAVVSSGKPAVTHYRICERYRAHTLIQVHLETGRTHQIRVHMAHLGHALLGDPLYGPRPTLPRSADVRVREGIQGFKRQALHACGLSLEHPVSGEDLRFKVPLPEDLQRLCELLREDAGQHD